MKMRQGLTFLAAGFTMFLWGIAQSPAAVVLYTTQTDFSNTTGGGAATAAPGTQGDVDGSTTNGLATLGGGTGPAGALDMDQTGTGYNQVNLGDESSNQPFLNAVADNTTLNLWYYLPQTITLASTGSNYFQIIPVWNWTGGYQQMSNNAVFDSAGLTAGFHEVSYDYSAYSASLQSILTTKPSYFQLLLAINSGGSQANGSPETGIIDADDISVGALPEPATLGLLAFAGVGLLSRRRHA